MTEKPAPQSSQPVSGPGGEAAPPAGQAGAPTQAEIDNALAAARTLLAAGRRDDARTLLRRLMAVVPERPEAWLQLLALDPPPEEEIELLEGFLYHHPQHRFVPAFRARLEDTRIIALLGEGKSTTGQPTTSLGMRLGEYMVQQNWVTPEQVEQVLEEQRRLREEGIDLRVGAIMLMLGYLRPEQLAVALAASSSTGFGEFGDYLVRENVLTPHQVGMALARQAAIAAEHNRAYLDALRAYRAAEAAAAQGKRSFTRMIRTPSPPKRKPVPKLGEVLVSMGLLTEKQVDSILKERQTTMEAWFE